jgi:pimeloyl-ACP methyl ester carboxylesterase
MSTFVLLPGAGGMASYWHGLVPLLQEAGHEAIAVELPADDASAGLDDYAEIVIAAIGDRRDSIVVAQSLGGFTAPVVCTRAPARMLVFVNAMIPRPNERVGDWSKATGATDARLAAARAGGYTDEFNLDVYFFHDVPREALVGPERDQTERIFEDVCRFDAWPTIPIHVIAGRDDRFFPVDFQHRVARERLRVDVDEIAGGHLVALSNPGALAAQLLAYLREIPDRA